MFRISLQFPKILALLLPVALLCSCLACVAICSQITRHAEIENAACPGENAGAGISVFSAGCPLNVTPVTPRERQTIDAPALASSNINLKLPPHDSKFVSPAVHASRVKQPSPPDVSPPLYLKLRNFRI
jgi:hypothetical protein